MNFQCVQGQISLLTENRDTAPTVELYFDAVRLALNSFSGRASQIDARPCNNHC